MMNLQGKVAIVTGAARGLGAAIARQLCTLGASVVLTDVLEEAVVATSQNLTAEGFACCGSAHDVSVAAQWDAVVALALSRFGRLDFLVNNAGINIAKTIDDATPEEFQRILSVNLLGAFIGMQAVIPVLTQQGGGAIVNIASNSTRMIVPMASMYSASKAALANLTKTTAVHLAQTGTGIRVNSVHPGPHASPMILGEVNGADVVNYLRNSVPMGRLGEPEEVAALVAFLLSDASSYMTGAEAVLDGGLSLL